MAWVDVIRSMSAIGFYAAGLIFICWEIFFCFRKNTRKVPSKDQKSTQ